MTVIEKIVDSTLADTDVLRRLNQDGDDFSKFREVDFHFKCSNEQKAKVVAEFLGDYQFGQTTIEISEEDYFVNVVINMPVTQQVLLCISGFMTCIAELYDVDFDGWGCIAQNNF